MKAVEVRTSRIGGSRLVRDYLNGVPAATQLLGGSPYDIARYRERSSQLQARFTPPLRAAAAGILQPAGNGGAAKLKRFVEFGGVAVTTGQQAGLFGGPAYSLYKAATAVRLADHLEAVLGCCVLPIFWIASEDHDWAEVDHTFAIDGDRNLCRIEVAPDDNAGAPIADRVLTTSVESAVDTFSDLFGPQAVNNPHLMWIKGAYQPGVGMATAFRELLHRQFAETPLLTVDAADPALKALSAGTLHREFECAAEASAALLLRSDQLRQLGYHEQVAVVAGAPNLFVHRSSGRVRLQQDARGWPLPEHRAWGESAEVAATVRDDPTRFSPNALLRPVVENAVFPTLAYVGGPGEIAYYAQLPPLFALHDLQMPVVVPRASATVVDADASAALADLGLDLELLEKPLHRLEQRVLRSAVSPQARSELWSLREEIVSRYDALIHAAAAAPDVARSLGTLRNRALLDARKAEARLLRHHRRSGDEVAELRRVSNFLRPLGLPQDRVLNGTFLLARFGDEVLGEVVSQALPEAFTALDPASFGAA